MAVGIRIRLVLGALRLGLGASVANPYRGRRIRPREMGEVGSQSRWRKKSVRSFRYALATAVAYRPPIRRKFLAVRIGYRGNGWTRSEESGADWLPGLATGLERVQSLEMPSEVAN